MATDYDKELDSIREDLDDLHDNKVDVVKGKQLSTNDFTDEHLRKVNRIETKEYQQEIVSGVAKELERTNDNHVRLADEVHRHIRYGSEADNKFKKEVEDSLKDVVNRVRNATDAMNSIKENWDDLVKEDKDHEGRITQLEGQSERYDSSINSNTGAIESIRGEQVIQNTQIKELQDKSVELETRVVDVEVSDAEQNHRLDIAENRIGTFTDRMTALEDGYAQRDARMDGLDAQVSRYTERIHNVELTEKAQNDRIKAEEEKNKRQDIDIACLYAEAKDRTITINTEGTAVELQNSREGFVTINSIEGNTMVNCNKDVDKEVTLLTSIVDKSADNSVTLTEGVVDDGLVDVYLEGNTLVNVSKTKDSTAITKAYTVENSGNHIALQGDVDGSCRPVVTGNTLWIDNDTEEVLTAFDETKNLRLQSTFEDNLVTQEMVDNGEEVADNLGKYRVDYKVTGKNKFSFGDLKGGYISKNVYIPKGTYTISSSCIAQYEDNPWISFEGKSGNIIGNASLITGKTITFNEDIYVIRFYSNGWNWDNSNDKVIDFTNIQIEEGDTATSYEPYKEYTKTLYLNSPLLEGDTIEEKDGGIYHVHRNTEIVLDGSEEWHASTQWISSLHFWCRIEGKGGGISRLLCDKNNEFYGDGYYWDDNIIFKNDVSNFNNIKEFKTWLQTNRPKVLYGSSPQYELIEQSNLAIPSYANGHLDLTSAVPVEKVDFLPFSEELTYLYANTQYTVQFISDKATTADITLGGTQLLAQSIVKGLNRISITTPETLVNNKLVIDGTGANIREIVVTDTDREFGYFEGMKSVGECEGNKIEILSRYHYIDYNSRMNQSHDTKPIWSFYTGLISDYLQYFNEVSNYISCEKLFDYYYIENNTNLWINLGSFYPYEAFEILNIRIAEGEGKINKKEMTHEPLRAVGDVKDRYVLIDGNWYIERRCGSAIFDGSDDENWVVDNQNGDNGDTSDCVGFKIEIDDMVEISGSFGLAQTGIKLKCNLLPCMPTYSERINGVDYGWGKFFFIKLDKNMDENEFRNNLKINPMQVIYQLATPVYEPINYNPFEVYSDTTHISTNSTIPCNVTVKNHGYNCILKPSTTYTVVSNQGVQNMTTPATLGDSLRFSGNGLLKDVMILEGTLSDNQIPGFFAGMESCYEQKKITDEHDEHFGYYEVTAKVVGKNLFNGEFIGNGWIDTQGNVFPNNSNCYSDFIQITPCEYLTLSSVNTLTGGIVAQYDKNKRFISQRDKPLPNKVSIDAKTKYVRISINNSSTITDEILQSLKIQLEQEDTATEYEPYKESVIKFYIKDPLRGIGEVKDKVFIQNDKVIVQRNCGIRPYEDGDFSTYITDKANTIYPLAEPTYEEAVYSGIRLSQNIWEKSTLFFDTNIPSTANISYSVSTPILDQVAEVSSITDDQDALIIDMATQLAVLNMTM